MFERVDPFIGTEATSLPEQHGLATTWWWPKPQVGNTHPGATYPLGMVSACAYSGGYPTGYGRYDLGTEGLPERDARPPRGQRVHALPAVRHGRDPQVLQLLPRHPDAAAARRPGPALGHRRRGRRARLLLGDARQRASARRSRSGPSRAVHRYTFPAHRDARLVIDFSLGGLTIPHGRTVPLRAHLHSIAPGRRAGRDHRRGRAARRARRVRRPALAADALVRPAAHARRHAARLRPHPADHAAPVRAHVGRSVGARAGGRAAVRVLAARRRPGPREPRGASAVRVRPALRRGGRRPPRSGGRRSARSASTPRRPTSRRSSRRRSTTR